MSTGSPVDISDADREIYRPETLSQVEQSGFSLSTIKELADIQTDTAGQAIFIMDELGHVSAHLSELVKEDEKNFVQDAQRALNHKLQLSWNNILRIQDPQTWVSIKRKLSRDVSGFHRLNDLMNKVQSTGWINEFVSKAAWELAGWNSEILSNLLMRLSPKALQTMVERFPWNEAWRFELLERLSATLEDKEDLTLALIDGLCGLKYAPGSGHGFSRYIRKEEIQVLSDMIKYHHKKGSLPEFFKAVQENDLHTLENWWLFFPVHEGKLETVKYFSESYGKLLTDHEFANAHFAGKIEEYIELNKFWRENIDVLSKLPIDELEDIILTNWKKRILIHSKSDQLLYTRSLIEKLQDDGVFEHVTKYLDNHPNDQYVIPTLNNFFTGWSLSAEDVVFDIKYLEKFLNRFEGFDDDTKEVFASTLTRLLIKLFGKVEGEAAFNFELYLRFIEQHLENGGVDGNRAERFERFYQIAWFRDLSFLTVPEEMETFFQILESIPEDRFKQILSSFSRLEKSYGQDLEKMKITLSILLEISEDQFESISRNLYSLQDAYQEDLEKMREIFLILKDIPSEQRDSVTYCLSSLREVYGTDLKRMREILTVLEDIPIERMYSISDPLASLQSVYGADLEKMREALSILVNISENQFKAIADSLIKLHEVYGSDLDQMKGVSSVLEDIPDERFALVSQSLIALQIVYGKDLKKMRRISSIFIEIPEAQQQSIKKLAKFGAVYEGNTERVEKAVKYSEITNIFDETVLRKYIEIFEEEGELKAREYLEGLHAKAKGLICSNVPERHRVLPEYQYLVRYVFPDGNYSNYAQNLACGDRLEHLDKYRFEHEGYPVVLTGLLGYKVKEGAEPSQDLLSGYQGRLDGIRQFVASRGPDNKALQKTFEEKVDAVFKKKAWPEFKTMEEPTLTEKMLCLFLGETVRRGEKGESSEPNFEICDLIVEYKYAYHEDLEAYVARSSDSVKAYVEKASQDYMLLAELSSIYGENVKHVLRHDIFEGLEESRNYDRIVEVFSERLGGASEEKDLTVKQWSRIKNTFDNPHITEKGQTIRARNTKTGVDEDKYKPGKREVLYKQTYDIFSSNIIFEDEEQRGEFEDKLKEIFTELESNFTVGTFKALLPRFYKLRSLYRSGINAKLTELFTYDINQIFEELAKYEERIEEEAKQKSMGGPKDKISKKSSKKRNIRGYFTKTAETANARMGAYLCIAGDKRMWENENYFEFVLEDEDTGKCVGLTMLMEIREKDGKKYLWFGPNPFESFLDVVSSEKCYKYLYDKVCTFAEQNDFDGIVVPPKDEQILGQCTNRGGDFPGFIKASRLRNKKGNLKLVNFGDKHMLGLDYGYNEGALIWEREKSI